MKTTARAKEKTGVAGCKKETCKHFAKPSTKKIRWRTCEIKSNFGKRNLNADFFFS